MEMIYLWIISIACQRTIGTSSVDCYFDNNLHFFVAGTKYRCEVSNLNISSPESAIIDSVSGTHKSGKSNNDEIYFNAHKKHIEFFPRGLEKFFTNLTGIAIWDSQLKEIHQEDLRLYTRLKHLRLSVNNIEVIEDGLFDFQPGIENILFEHCKIFHISSTVFDHLSKLTTLYLRGNNCINKYTEKNRTGVCEVIQSAKKSCISSDYLKLDEKLKNLEQSSKNINADNLASFKGDFENFRDDFRISNISGFQGFKNRIIQITKVTESIVMDKIEEISKSVQSVKNSLVESNNRTANRNQWMIIATGIIAFTQTIFFVVIYMQFIQ